MPLSGERLAPSLLAQRHRQVLPPRRRRRRRRREGGGLGGLPSRPGRRGHVNMLLCRLLLEYCSLKLGADATDGSDGSRHGTDEGGRITLRANSSQELSHQRGTTHGRTRDDERKSQGAKHSVDESRISHERRNNLGGIATAQWSSRGRGIDRGSARDKHWGS